MIITDSFVMLNYPKTGSTFARKVIKDLYASVPRRWFHRPYCLDLILPNIRHEGEPDQHGCYCQIPKRYQKREVVSIIRNPYDRFLSGYEFRYWAYFPPRPIEVIQQSFPTFPNLTLDEYVDFFEQEYGSAVGPQTFQFMQLFSRQLPPKPKSIPSLKSVLDGVGDVTFLRQEYLASDLMAFLQRKGFSPEQTAFIATHERLNVTTGGTDDRSRLWTLKALEFVSRAESLLFDILFHYGISCDVPQPSAAEYINLGAALSI
jgi:hypothetical protein